MDTDSSYQQLSTKEALAILRCGHTVFYAKVLPQHNPKVIKKGNRNYYLRNEIIQISLKGWI